jgi:2-oxoglutarate ferredoxin oxidoreductase subunit alpha
MAAQGDMMQCRFGSHGDTSIIAVSPSSVQEMFDLTVKAFNLSDRFRVPVFVMADEAIGHMRERIVIPDQVEIIPRKEYERGSLPFHPGDDGVPPFPTFGNGYGVHVTGLTHDERGYPETTNSALHEDLVNRLVAKVESARHEIADYDIVNPEAKVVFITYGAPTRAVGQVVQDNPEDSVGHLNLRIVWPFPEKMLDRFENAEVFLVPELNLGQIAREIQRHTDKPVISLPKLGGGLHTPAELKQAVEGYR